MRSALHRKEILAVALATLSVLGLAFSNWTGAPRVDKGLHTSIGQSLASEALKLVKPGGKIVLIARDTEAFAQPAMDILYRVIETQITRAGKEIRQVQRVQLDPIRPSAVPSGDFYELLRRSAAGDVIISLLGPPILDDEERVKLGRPRASVVALCIGNPIESLPMLFESGLLHVGLVRNVAATASTVNRFDQLYTVLRANPSG